MTYFSQTVSYWDTSTHCAECGVEYAYCGCPNEDSGPFSLARECSSCYGEFPVLFTFGGSTKERCDVCHNSYAAGHGLR